MGDHEEEHEMEQAVDEGPKRQIRRWTQEEHSKLVELVAKQQEAGNNEICWSAIARELPGRTGKQCRHRWVNSCQPFTKRGVWDLDEEHIVAQLHASHGSAWSHIASKLKGRSENSVKNHYNALFRSKYLDSKKESVLANYVKLLRDGLPQCVETYEQALDITRVYREQAMNRISHSARMMSQQRSANIEALAGYANNLLDGGGSSSPCNMDAGPSSAPNITNLSNLVASAAVAATSSRPRTQPTSSVSGVSKRSEVSTGQQSWVARQASPAVSGQELVVALGADLMQGQANLGFDPENFDWQYTLPDLEGEGEPGGAAGNLSAQQSGFEAPHLPHPHEGFPRDQELAAGMGPAAWELQHSQQLGSDLGTNASNLGDTTSEMRSEDGGHQPPGRQVSLLGRTAMFSQMNGLSLQAIGDLDLQQLLDSNTMLETPHLVLGMGGGGGPGAGNTARSGLRSSCPALGFGLGLGPTDGDDDGMMAGDQYGDPARPDAYGNWISYSGHDQLGTNARGPAIKVEPGSQQLPSAGPSSQFGEVCPPLPETITIGAGAATKLATAAAALQDLVGRTAVTRSPAPSTPARASANPLLQMMAANLQQGGEEASMLGCIGEDQALDTAQLPHSGLGSGQGGGHSSFTRQMVHPASGDAISPPVSGNVSGTKSRRRSYAELYADSSSKQEGSRSQPQSSLFAELARTSGPITGSGGLLNLSNLQRHGSSSLYAGTKRSSQDISKGLMGAPLHAFSSPLEGLRSASYTPGQYPDGSQSDRLQQLSDTTPSPPAGSGNPSGSVTKPHVAWGSSRDAVFLPPGWAPHPDLDDDTDLDLSYLVGPRAPRIRRVGEGAGSVSGNLSATPSPANTAATDPPPQLSDLDDVVSVPASQRRRHSMCFLPTAGGSAPLPPMDVNMSDLAAYVPGQNRKATMSVLPTKFDASNLPAPMAMGVSDAPQQTRRGRARRRSVDPYTSPNSLLDQSLLSLMTQANRTEPNSQLSVDPDLTGDMQLDTLLQPAGLSGLSDLTGDNHTGLSPMVSGIDLQRTTTASGSVVPYPSDPGSAASCPPSMPLYANMPFGSMQRTAAEGIANQWDELQAALMNVQQQRDDGGSGHPATQQYGSGGSIGALANAIQLQLAQAGSADGQQRSPLLSTSPSPAGSTTPDCLPLPLIGRDGIPLVVPSDLGDGPAAMCDPLASAAALDLTAGRGNSLDAAAVDAAAAALGDVVDGGDAVAGHSKRPNLAELDTSLSMSFTLNRLLSPSGGDMLFSPQGLGSIFKQQGSVDLKEAGENLLHVIPSITRDDNSFKQRLELGAPVTSLDVLLGNNNSSSPEGM